MTNKPSSIYAITIIFVSLAYSLPNYSALLFEPVPFQVTIYDPTNQNGGCPKKPILPPTISLDDHTLYFDTPCDGCTLNIVDSNDTVVYTTVIPTGATSLVLPATLSGKYGLQIISGNYLFYGTIDLP